MEEGKIYKGSELQCRSNKEQWGLCCADEYRLKPKPEPPKKRMITVRELLERGIKYVRYPMCGAFLTIDAVDPENDTLKLHNDSAWESTENLSNRGAHWSPDGLTWHSFWIEGPAKPAQTDEEITEDYLDGIGFKSRAAGTILVLELDNRTQIFFSGGKINISQHGLVQLIQTNITRRSDLLKLIEFLK